MELEYFGHSAVALNGKNHRILIDPWLTANPHTDVGPTDFDDVTAILVTHGADDHLGDAPAIAELHDAPIFCDAATASVLLERRFPHQLLEPHIWGPKIEYDEWEVRIMQARHQSAFIEHGVIGPALAYLVTLDDRSIYHMGDTAIFATLKLYGELYSPDITLIPVGGVASYYPELYPEEAVLVAEWLESDTYIPIHYDVDSPRPGEFVRLCQEQALSGDVVSLAAGDTLSP